MAKPRPVKRFYKGVGTAPQEGGWQVALDARPVRTAQGKPQIVPGEALADALAREWADQGETIDLALFRYRDLADFAIDIVAPDRPATIAKLLAFAETDTLCYRADPDEPFHRRQLEVWEPLVAAFEAREGVALERVSGIVHKPQNAETLDRLRAKLGAFDEFTLAALQAMTALSASLCIGLSALDDDVDAERLWDASSLEEDWQAEQWGRDAEAETVRARRRDDFLNAWNFARLARG